MKPPVEFPTPPARPHCIAGGEAWEPRIQAAVWAFVALGVLLRLVRYLLRFPLWGDECMVAVNFLDRGYGDMLQPLLHHQICPPAFLWIELAIVRTLGFSEWTLRLFPTICSVASVFLFRHVAAKVLSGVPLLLAVGVFCVAYYPIRHGAEVKQYSCDLLVSLILLSLALAWRREPQRTRYLWWLTAVVPLAVWSSLPAVFVAGGISLSLLPTVWKTRSTTLWVAFCGFNAALLVGFASLYFAFIEAHSSAANAGGVHKLQVQAFPPLPHVGHTLTWLLGVHTGRMFAYPIGDDRGASALTTVCFVIGAVYLLRRREGSLLLLFLSPFVLALVAAAGHKYPYGTSARFMLYLAPIICLLAGLGAGAVAAALPRIAWRRGAVLIAVAVLTVFGGGVLTRDIVAPYKTAWDARIRDFERWLWTDKASDGELICVATESDREFFAGFWHAQSAQYLCNQRIYSARHRASLPPRPEAATADHPLRCLIASAETALRDPAALQAWLGDMRKNYVLVGYEQHRVNPGTGDIYGRLYEIFEFVPASAADNASDRSLSPLVQRALKRQRS